MYRKGLGPSNLSDLDENPDYTCPDKAESPVFVARKNAWIIAIMSLSMTWIVWPLLTT